MFLRYCERGERNCEFECSEEDACVADVVKYCDILGDYCDSWSICEQTGVCEHER